MRLRDWKPPADDFEEPPRWRSPPVIEHRQTPWGEWYAKASPLDVLIFATCASLAAGALLFFGGIALIVVWHYL